MKIKIFHIGKLNPIISELVEMFSKRISNYSEFELISVKQARNLPEHKVKSVESESLLQKLDTKDYIVALTEEGKQLDSRGFAQFIADIEITSRPIVFLIGGAFGLSEEAKSRADVLLSLSSMTFQHDIALAVLLEQTYRAFTILHGEDYHK